MPWVQMLLAGALMGGIMTPAFFRLKAAGKKGPSLAVKGGCTLVAAILGLVGAFHHGEAAAWGCFAGLVVCAGADIAIGINFMAGVALFFLGHGVYIAAFTQAVEPTGWIPAVFLLLLSILFGLFRTWHDAIGPERRIPFLIYAVMLCLMCAFAVPMLWQREGVSGWFVALGALLFALSDGLLLRNLLFGSTLRQEQISLSIYYAGQWLLGAAWLFGG